MRDGKRSGGGASARGVDFMTILKGVVLVVAAYVLVGPATVSQVLSGTASVESLSAAIVKLGGAGVVVGILHLPFPTRHGRGWHIIGWSIGAVVLLLSRDVWFPTAVRLFLHVISLANGLVPPG
jgi:hypothetical protein